MGLDVGSTPLTTHSLGKLAEDYSVENDARIDQQHDGQGRHTDITVDSVAAGDGEPETEGGRVTVFSGFHFRSGPWDMGLTDSVPGAVVIRPPTLTANQNNYHPDGLETCVVIELESTAARTITGIYQEPMFGDPVRRRRFLWLVNRGNYTITLASASGSSNSAYQLYFGGGDYPLLSGSIVQLYYDPGAAGWRGPAMTGFRSVQRGTISITGTNTNASVVLATELTDVSKAVVEFLGCSPAGGGADQSEFGYLADLTTTSLKAYRQSGASGSTTVVAYQVTEYY